MTSFIETLNASGDFVVRFAWPLLWQSSLLIVIVAGLDRLLRRKLRPAVRYALWLVVLLKLLLPPSLALPTAPAWWLRSATRDLEMPIPPRTVIVRLDNLAHSPAATVEAATATIAPGPRLSLAAWVVTISVAVSAGLSGWLLLRWRKVAGQLKRTGVAPDFLEQALSAARASSGIRHPVRVRVTKHAVSPAVCGLFRPILLLPESLPATLNPKQLHAILLHELIHLQRRDVWVNCLQALLQVLYWWHPLVWLANARIRRLREEAVDDAVMLALAEESAVYAPTLLEVAKFAAGRQLTALGLIGILESRSALRQRIERLIHFRAPGKAGLSLLSLVSIVAFTVAAVPMGEPSFHAAQSTRSDQEHDTIDQRIETNKPVPNIIRDDVAPLNRNATEPTTVPPSPIQPAPTLPVHFVSGSSPAAASTSAASTGPGILLEAKFFELTDYDPSQGALARLGLATNAATFTPLSGPDAASELKMNPVANRFLRLDKSADPTIARILTGPDTTALIQELTEKGTLLSAPKLVADSGGLAGMSVLQVMNVVLLNDSNAAIACPVNAGFVLTVEPLIGADGAVELKARSSVTEFLGYDDPGRSRMTNTAAGGKVTIPLPHFRLRELAWTGEVPAGGTLVLAGPAMDSQRPITTKVPFLGDIPILGHLFRSSRSNHVRKNLIVLITPRIGDPTTNVPDRQQ